MSDATDYLNSWIQIGALRAPSMTCATCQASPGVGPPPNWMPGVATYGWGFNGHLVQDSNGNNIGIQIPEVFLWFSNRGQDTTGPPPIGQQFIEAQFDKLVVAVTLAGDGANVTVTVTNLSAGNTVWSADTSLLDNPSQQLLFSTPGVQGVPSAVMLLSFADTGQFGWL